MAHPSTAPETVSADLERLQLEVLRSRVARARRLSEAERLAEAFALTDGVVRRIHEGQDGRSEHDRCGDRVA